MDWSRVVEVDNLEVKETIFVVDLFLFVPPAMQWGKHVQDQQIREPIFSISFGEDWRKKGKKEKGKVSLLSSIQDDLIMRFENNVQHMWL